MKKFDLNIDKILEDWELSHAVRELLANALDETAIVCSKRPPEVAKRCAGSWSIRDYGRGLRYQNLIQSEDPEKLKNSSVIGKFGVGLKDALATFERRGVGVQICSRHGDLELVRASKHSFEDMITLHAVVHPPSDSQMIGTECRLLGIEDSEIQSAMDMFVQFKICSPIESTRYGDIFPRFGGCGEIFINGLKVASEPDFLFSYNITSLTSQIKKSLNRERQNVGRTAYSDRVKSILLESSSEYVKDQLVAELQALSRGEAHAEISWLEIQNLAVKVLNSRNQYVFAGVNQICSDPSIADRAQSIGREVVAIPDSLTTKIKGSVDIVGQAIMEVEELGRQYNESFEFKWVDPNCLSESELQNWNLRQDILDLMGGKPDEVRDIRISEKLCGVGSLGLWVPQQGLIVVKRSELSYLSSFAGVLLHEAIHAEFNAPDVSREFEKHLTNLVGNLTSRLLEAKAPAQEKIPKYPSKNIWPSNGGRGRLNRMFSWLRKARK